MVSISNLRPAILQVLEEVFEKIDAGQEYEIAINPEKIRK
jgi:FKBP-type peptidyl-prolyl cis-trans isomerase 2